MFEDALSAQAKNTLNLLKKEGLIEKVYLAGGSGLALELGHRLSEDLDFFSQEEFDTQLLLSRLRRTKKFKLFKEEWGTIIGRLGGVKISFLVYPYPLLKKPKNYLGLKIAHPIDIALMKLEAIASRGTKRDFIDIYVILKTIPLKKMISFLPKKFDPNYNFPHLFRSLVYFEEAEKEEMPKMLIPLAWNEVKKFFIKEVKKISKEYL